jgi:AraC family transcriptional regulator of adaptative response/methylated-DNA-[protein]-cysteine methyltransferase
MTHDLPTRDEMTRAFLARDASYEGVFFTGVRTTGIFCHPTCPSKKPRPENVEFFATAREALFAGFRACKRCRPLSPSGATPEWLEGLLEAVDSDPTRRWRDHDLRRLGLQPERVRRWFHKHHDMSFHAYARARRLSAALERIREGGTVIDAAFDHGYESLSGFNEAFRKLLGASPTQAADAPLVRLTRLATPLGAMLAGATDEALCLLEYSDRRMLELQLRRIIKELDCRVVPGSNPVLEKLAGELEAYFAGRLERFETPLRAPGTPFQEAVWERLLRIPHGATTSYGALAAELGRPTASRAVARAVGDNRIAIVIPCHRVVGSDGSLTGYGGGLWRKQRLLELERGSAAGAGVQQLELARA